MIKATCFSIFQEPGGVTKKSPNEAAFIHFYSLLAVVYYPAAGTYKSGLRIFPHRIRLFPTETTFSFPFMAIMATTTRRLLRRFLE
ncbi:hypothetical protein [Candidatus Sororendozoicomonas aggregata]|uniref:hypothetical protein n=1 Tax=Candidatus Sororendozoicomonas aggregata TaxID=3073239 RepID=UPI002ED5736D